MTIKCLQCLSFSGRMHSIYIQYTSHKQIIKRGGSFSGTLFLV